MKMVGIVWPPGVRLQLTLWYTVVFAILLVLSDAILYTQLQTSLLESLDTALRTQATEIASGLSVDGGGSISIQDVTGDLPDISTGNATGTDQQQGSHVDITFSALVRILDMHGQPLRTTPAFRTLILPTTSVTQPSHGTTWQGDVTTRSGQAVRVYSMAVTENGKPFAIVQVGESLLQLQTSLRSVLLELLLLAPLVLCLGAVGSYWLAARAFRPIDRLTRTARQIKAGDLQRVPVPHARDEVRRLAQTLNEMIERLDLAFTHQRRFVADASHELRTPVAVIRSMTDLALLQDLSSQEYKALFESINTETERLGHLISDLLALARVDEGKAVLECEPVRLDQLVSAVAANAELLAAEHGITVEVQASEAITVSGDESRLIQAVMNLLDNAIIYTNSGGKVTLTVERKEQVAQLIVRDTGIGIAAEHVPHIFERFYRADPARVRTEGNSSGLGLALVEWVMKAHRGSITVESQPGRGTTFLVTLPLASAPPSGSSVSIQEQL